MLILRKLDTRSEVDTWSSGRGRDRTRKPGHWLLIGGERGGGAALGMSDLEDGRHIALQRDTNLKSATIQVALFSHFFLEIRPCSRASEKTVLFEPTLDHTYNSVQVKSRIFHIS